MQETFIVTVTTEGGRCLIQEKITGDCLDLLSLLLRLSHVYSLALRDGIKELEMELGFGTGQSASDFSSPTDS